MNRIILFFVFVLGSLASLSQSISYRSNGVVTVSDARLQAQYNLFLPRYKDTAQANLQKGIDSCGAIIYTSDNVLWQRSCEPKRWTPVSNGGGSSSNFYGTQLISGNAVWDSLYIFNITRCTYYILGRYYTSLPDTVHLAASNPTNPRIDVIYLDTLGNVGVITGVPSANPSKPVVNPVSQIELTHVNVAAGSSSPSGISKMIVYNENAQLPTEWNTSTTAIPGIINFNYTTNPYVGTKSLFTSIQSPKYPILFSHVTPINADTAFLMSIFFRINSAEGTAPHFFVILKKSGVFVTDKYSVSAQAIIGSYQQITIPMNSFVFTSSNHEFDEISIYNISSANSGYQYDYITIQFGGNPPPTTSNYWSLNGNDISTSPEAKLGTTSKDSLNIVTSDESRIVISNDGIIKFPNIQTSSDTSLYKPLGIDTLNNSIARMSNWGTSGGGSGTVTSVATGYGLSGGTITTSGTLLVDTATLSTKYLRVSDNDTIYTTSPIMTTISGDSTIIYFNADTANAWRDNLWTKSGSIITNTAADTIKITSNLKIDTSAQVGTYIKNSAVTSKIHTDGIISAKEGFYIGDPTTSPPFIGGTTGLIKNLFSSNYYNSFRVMAGGFNVVDFNNLTTISNTNSSGLGSVTINPILDNYYTTGGQKNALSILPSINAISANSITYNQINIRPTYNQSTLGVGILRGIYYNPNITALNSSKHIALESTSGNVILKGLKTSSSTTDSIAIFVNDTLTKAPYPSVGTGFVPYTGATQDVDLGTNKISTQSVYVTGTNGNGHIHLKHQASDATATVQSTSLFADSNGDIKWKNDGNYYTTLKTSTNTADAVYTFPSATTTLIGATDTSVFQRKQIAAYSIMANTTNAAANATPVYFKDTSGTYAGNITWTGTTPPSNLSISKYNWTRIGKQVTLFIAVYYTTAGTSLTQVNFDLPADAPTPDVSYFTTLSANNLLYQGFGALGTSANILQNNTVTNLRRNAANTGYEFQLSGASQGYRRFQITITYMAQ